MSDDRASLRKARSALAWTRQARSPRIQLEQRGYAL